VAGELERLLQQGIDHLHTCDGEFNLPPWHADEVCREIIRRGGPIECAGTPYCSPAPFTPDWPGMRQAVAMGINFGVDSGDPKC